MICRSWRKGSDSFPPIYVIVLTRDRGRYMAKLIIIRGNSGSGPCYAIRRRATGKNLGKATCVTGGERKIT